MNIVRLPDRVRAIVFDLDNTLYTNPAYAAFQHEGLEARLADRLGLPREYTKAKLDELRAGRRAAGLPATSMGNLCLELGVPIETSVAWREELFRPGHWLRPDPRLDDALGTLTRRCTLVLVTNNPSSVGRASLAALGVERHFRFVVGLDLTLRSKPDPEPFALALRLLGESGSLGDPGSAVPGDFRPGAQGAGSVVSVGDRYDVDIAPALALGMGGGILVDGVEDVYLLPDLLP